MQAYAPNCAQRSSYVGDIAIFMNFDSAMSGHTDLSPGCEPEPEVVAGVLGFFQQTASIGVTLYRWM